MRNAHSWTRRYRRLSVPIALLLLLSLAFPALTGAASPHTLVPIGGGYAEPTLIGFAEAVAEHTDDDTIDLVVVPSSYGDAPEDREENIELAQERTDQIEEACDIVAGEQGFADCSATLLLLFDRADAENPANSEAFTSSTLDGAYILGGDQTIAMLVLADSIAEQRMADAYERGVVFGGTSAGNAVESRDMIAGYTDPGWPYNALQREMVDVWWYADGDHERGLIFGSERVIFDQHFYERGRFGRLLNVIAQSDEVYDGASKLGVGVDWGTGVRLADDTLLHDVFGYSSAAIVDFESLGATHSWQGASQTLSARNVLTHIMAGDEAASYDVTTRTPMLGGATVEPTTLAGWNAPDAAGSATLYLGGDLLTEESLTVARSFVRDVQTKRSGRVLLLLAGYANSSDAFDAGSDYIALLEDAGLNTARYPVTASHLESTPNFDRLISTMRQYDAVIVAGGDQSLMGAAIEEYRLGAVLSAALGRTRVVMTDGAATAVMGDWYVTDTDPGDDYQDEGIADFTAGGVEIAPGLGLVPGFAFEPTLTWDQRWGRIYQLAGLESHPIALGISELTAIRIQGNVATVVGDRSVIALDGRGASYGVGAYDAIFAWNVVMDIFAPGDAVRARR